MTTIRLSTKNNKISVVNRKTNISVSSTGRRGPKGDAGESDKNYEQSFTNQSSIVINHSLNKFPSVTIKDSAGDEVEGSVEHLTKNNIKLTFSSSFTGMVICN